MRLKGKIYKNKFLLAEVASLGAVTQGVTKKEAYGMLKEYLELQIENYLDRKVKISIWPVSTSSFEVEADESNILFAFLLRMSRVNSQKTIGAVKESLGFKSNNSYQAYEHGEREPSLSKMESLLKALSPNAKMPK